MYEFDEIKNVDLEVVKAIALVMESEDNIEKVQAMVAELTEKYPLC